MLLPGVLAFAQAANGWLALALAPDSVVRNILAALLANALVLARNANGWCAAANGWRITAGLLPMMI